MNEQEKNALIDQLAEIKRMAAAAQDAATATGDVIFDMYHKLLGHEVDQGLQLEVAALRDERDELAREVTRQRPLVDGQEQQIAHLRRAIREGLEDFHVPVLYIPVAEKHTIKLANREELPERSCDCGLHEVDR